MTPDNRLYSLLKSAGAVAFGVARAAEVEQQEWQRFERWLEAGFHAGMDYMRNYPDLRRDPRLLLEGARSIISVAFNYRQPNPYPEIATYALGEDYHKVLRKRLKPVVAELRDELGGNWRICIDSAPILERYWALKSGVGYRSPKSGCVVVPGVGSMVFLAEIITDFEFAPTGELTAPQPDLGSDTSRCPTGALQPGGTVDGRRCINYLTIEKRRDTLTPQEKKMIGSRFFGCDVCQLGCPENQTPCPEILPEFLPLDGLGEFLKGENQTFDIKKSPMNRTFRG